MIIPLLIVKVYYTIFVRDTYTTIGGDANNDNTSKSVIFTSVDNRKKLFEIYTCFECHEDNASSNGWNDDDDDDDGNNKVVAELFFGVDIFTAKNETSEDKTINSEFWSSEWTYIPMSCIQSTV